MRARSGCRSVILAVVLAAVLPPLFRVIVSVYGWARPAVRSRALRMPPEPPACLEAWVRLRGVHGRPVLVGAGAYRLGLYGPSASRPGRASGALVFAGP